jgi:hypothetical protein
MSLGTHWIGGWVGAVAGPDTAERRKFLFKLKDTQNLVTWLFPGETVYTWYVLVNASQDKSR